MRYWYRIRFRTLQGFNKKKPSHQGIPMPFSAISATSQFFINLRDNEFLDKANSADGYCYCVFGQVTDGIEIVEQIGAVSTGNNAGHSDVPIENIIINEVTLIE